MRAWGSQGSARPRACLLAALLIVSAALVPGAAGASADRHIVVLGAERSPAGAAVAEEHARRHEVRPRAAFGHALEGYVADIPSNRIDDVRRDPRVAYVEPDRIFSAESQRLPWGIDRVEADRSSTRAGDGRGRVSRVHAYVLDSGVDAEHPDLNVAGQLDFADGPSTDCLGHGTHVTGTLAARDDSRLVVGVAPAAPVVSVKVLDCDGHGSTSDVVRGIDWVTAYARRPAVANLSISGSPSRALDDALRRSVRSGILYSVAAGNDHDPACERSPARAGAGTANGIVTVGALDSDDEEASFSNFGSCVDVWAPGVNVLSTRLGGGTLAMLGTSMAAPHAAGGAALRLSARPGATPAAVEASLQRSARPIEGDDGETLRRLSLSGF